MRETSIIEGLKALCPSNSSVKLGIGDDSAILYASPREQLVCADMLMEGVHFSLNDASPEQIGHKALGVNLSDIAAMGGEALSAFICLALPRQLAEARFIDRLYHGLGDLAQKFQLALAGGDTNIWQGPLVISVTVIGASHKKGAITRHGAKVGDVIMVTGPLGGSLQQHHLTFTPRLSEAKALMDEFDLHSMIDLSDGLAKDLREICSQSQVAACLEADSLPLRDNLQTLPKEEALHRALSDGEDFELCFTLDSAAADKLEQDPRFAYCRRIGRIVSGSGLYWGHGIQCQSAIGNFGYEHQS